MQDTDKAPGAEELITWFGSWPAAFDARWRHEPFNESETEAWKSSWKEADYEPREDPDAEF
jgi:hypothetical protein